MKNKKMIISVVVALLSSIVIFIAFNSFIEEMLRDRNSKSNSNSNITSNETSNDLDIITKKAEVIDFDKYKDLRSDEYEDETFVIIIMKSEDKISNTFKEEVLTAFNNKKCNIYELDIDKLDDEDTSLVISDITDIQKYKEPTLITPTMLISKKGKIVYVQEGLAYSTELKEKIKDKEIE